jgi:hypothetical protein
VCPDIRDATEQSIGDRIQLVDCHGSQLHRVGGVVDVVDLEDTVSPATGLVGHHQDVTRVHRCHLDVIGSIAGLRLDDTHESGVVLVVDIPNPHTGLGGGWARAVERAGVGESLVGPYIGRRVQDESLTTTAQLQVLGHLGERCVAHDVPELGVVECLQFLVWTRTIKMLATIWMIRACSGSDEAEGDDYGRQGHRTSSCHGLSPSRASPTPVIVKHTRSRDGVRKHVYLCLTHTVVALSP